VSTTSPRLSLVVAMGSNRVIGAGGALPWHIPADLKRFKALTLGHSIIMGRKTYASIGRLLPGRTSMIVTRSRALQVPGAIVVNSLDEALARCAGQDEVFVIGGGELYRDALTRAERIYLTHVHLAPEGDTFFPELAPQAWREIEREPLAWNEDGSVLAELVVLDRTP
jgi:dihydrofolate reductase